MKLKNSQLQPLLDVLLKLEPEGKPPFVFSGKVRYNLARNLKRLGSALDELESLRVKMVRERLAPGETELAEDTRMDFIRLYSDVLDAETDIDLFTVSPTDLDLDKNQIPLVVLTQVIGTVLTE